MGGRRDGVPVTPVMITCTACGGQGWNEHQCGRDCDDYPVCDGTETCRACDGLGEAAPPAPAAAEGKVIRWIIWSEDTRNQLWLAVDEGLTEKRAKDGAQQRNDSAAKYGMPARYVALPMGERP